MSGLFISFEGVDGCGKSTQVEQLVAWLRQHGVEPLTVREPGGTVLGERLRDVLLDPATGDIATAAEALLYAASRAELVASVIAPALAAGRVVVADRFVDSSLAYQGAGRGLGMDRVLAANELARAGTLPHLTLLLAVGHDVARGRREAEAAGAAGDRIEVAGDEFFSRVACAYEELAERWPERYVRIDASPGPPDVHTAVLEAVAPHLVRRGIALAPQEVSAP